MERACHRSQEAEDGVKIRWTMRAIGHLEEIFDRIADDRPDAARRMMARIVKTVSRCAEMPNSGRVGRLAGTREASVPGTAYIVFYRILAELQVVEVLGVLHGARRLPKSL
jgi:addiction module RelE/StbE family toxin